MQSRATTFLAVISLAIPGALNAQPATKNVFTVTPNLTIPIGIAYSPFVNKLLVTQPFCGTISGTKATGFQVVQVDPAGASSLFAILPDVPLSTDAGSFHTGSPYNQCFE